MSNPLSATRSALLQGAGWTALTALTLCWCGFAKAAHAQPFRGMRRRQETLPAMTLPQALRYAQDHEPQQQVALARVQATQAEARVPSAKRLPSVGATLQLLGATVNNTTAAYVGTPYVDVPRVGGSRAVGELKPQLLLPEPSTLLAVGVRQQVYDFGRVNAALDAGRALVNVERQRLTTVRLDVTQNVVEAYLAVHAAKSMLASARGALDRMRAHQDMTTAAVEQGLRAAVDLTKAEADVARMESGWVRAQGTLEITQARFAAAVGFSQPRLDATGDAPQWPPLPALEDAQTRAAQQEPAVLEAQARWEAARARTQAVAAEMRPELLLSAGVSTRAGGAPPSSATALVGSGLLPYVPNGFVGLVFNWPMLDPVTLARGQAAAGQENVFQEEVALALQRVGSRLAQVYVAAQVAQQSLPALERAQAAARANQAQMQERYHQGLGTALETADAENALAEAETQWILGTFEYAKTRAALDRAMGVTP